MNELFIVPARLCPKSLALGRRMRRGLLLSGATGVALSLGAPVARAQSVVRASTPTVSSSAAARAALNRARVQEAAGSLALAAVQYRDALVQAPTDAGVARELARFYTRHNRFEEASLEWKRVLIFKAGDAEATRELARASRLAKPEAKSTGVADVAPLPTVFGSKPQTRSVARTAPSKSTLPPVGQAPARATSTPSRAFEEASPSERVLLAQAAMELAQLPEAPSSDEPLPLPSSPSDPVVVQTPRATLAPLPAATNVSPIPFSLPARQTVSVSKKNRAAAWPYVNRAAQFLKAKRTQRALVEYERAADLDPTNAYAAPGVATAQLILGQFDESANTLRRFLTVAPDTARDKTLRDLANALTYGRRYREALGVNAFILSRTPNAFEAAFQNGQIYTYLRSYTFADAAFSRAFALDPNRPDALAAWGESLSYRRDPRAVDVFSRGLGLQPGNSRLTLGLANYYFYSGQFAQAVPGFRTILGAQPKNVAVLVSLGDSLSFSGKPADALGFYSRALNLQPKNAKASLGLGRALVYSGRFSEGVIRLNSVVAADPNNVGALEALALGQGQMKPPSPNALSTYARLLALQSEPAARARTLSSIGDLQLGRNDISGATQSYAQAAQLSPRDVKVNLVYAQLLSYGAQPNWPAAGDAARRVLALSPNNPQALALLLQSSLKTGDTATASQLATQLDTAAPATAEESLTLAQALRDAGNATASNRLLLRAASQVKDAQTLLRLADATRDAQDYPTAITLYQRLIQSQPNNAEARLGLTTTLLFSRNLNDAQAQLGDLLAILPNDKRAQILAATVQLRLGTPESLDNAARLANAVLAADPNNDEARTIVGQALVSRGRYADAAQQFQAAVASNPNNLDARIELARNLNYARDYESAIAQYRELISRAPADVTPRLELAQILLDRSRFPEAEALYNEVLTLKGGTALLPSVRRALASNSLRRLSPLVEFSSPLVRANALVRPRASKRRVVVNNPAPRFNGRLLAQNPTVSSPASPAATGGLGAGTNALPNATVGTDAGATSPDASAPTSPDVSGATTEAPGATVPSTPLEGTEGTGGLTAPPLQGGAVTSPPLQNGPDSPPVIDEAPVTDSGTTGTRTLPVFDSPLTNPRVDQGVALRGLGESRRRQSQFTQAIEFYNRALAVDPNDYQARVGIAQSLRGQGQFAPALEQVQQALTVEANFLPSRVLQAQLLADTGQTEQANTQLNALVASLPESPTLETYTQIALGLNSVKNYTGSLDLLGRATQQFPGETSVARLRAETLGFSGQTDASVSAYDQIIAADPRDVDAVIGKARIFNYANRLADAETTYRQALQVSSSSAVAQGELADILTRRGNYTEAIGLFQTAIAANPADLVTRINLARAQRRANQSADAEATLNQILDVDTNNVDALVERGLIRGVNGSYAPALADLNRALAINPNSTTAQLGVAQVQSYAGNYTDAIASYQAFLARNPGDARARTELAQTLGYAGRAPEALGELETVLTQTPDDTRALLARAEIFARTDRPADAVGIYNAVLSREPQNTQARTGLADALLYARRYPDAIRVYDEILASDPSNGAVRVSRARALSYAGRSPEAVAALRAIVADDSSNLAARLALAEAGANSGKAVLQRDAISEYRAILKDNPDNLNAQLGLARVLSYRGQNAEAQGVLNTILASNPGNVDARIALADTQRFSGDAFGAQKNLQLAQQTTGLSASQQASIGTGLGSLNRATSPSLGVSGDYYSDSNGVRLRRVNESAILRTRALTIGVLANQGRFRQNNLAERNRREIGILLARRFGPFAAQLIVSRLKYSGVNEKTLFSLGLNRDFSPRRRINISYSRRDIFETDLAVGSGITANILNVSGSTPLGARLDLDATATYYRYSDDNSRLTLSPALMFRFRPTNPTLRVGLGYTYDNTDQRRDAPFVYYTPQNFNAAAILADYIVATGRTRYGVSGAVPLTGQTGQNGINRPANTLFGFFERDFSDNLTFNIRGGIVRVPNGAFRSDQISGGLDFSF